MRKLLTIFLSLLMVFTMVPSVAFAAEPESLVDQSNSTAGNIDYYTYSTQYLDGPKTVVVYPVSNVTLKLHLYIESGTVQVWVKSTNSAYYTKKATWTSNGHHYVDLVSKTNGGGYMVMLYGSSAVFNGGIYSGN